MKLTREDVVKRLKDGDAERDLSGSDLTGLDLSRLDLRGTNLSRADLSAADLRWAILEGADLHSSVLRRADCRWAVLRGANLRQADLGRANLSWADVTGADLTGAQIEGANLENVDLSEGYAEGGVGGRGRFGWGGRGAVAGGAMTLPRSRAVLLAWLAGALAVGLLLWGWLYRRAFYDEFNIHDAQLTRFLSTENLLAGLKVALLTFKTLLVTPFVLALLAAIVVVVVIVPAGLILLGDRALKQSVDRKLRTPTTIALFAIYFLLAWALLIPLALSSARWLLSRALPAEEGLRATFTLATQNGLMAVGFLLIVGAAFYLVYVGCRLLALEIHRRDLPARWRLQYPRLNEAHADLRASRLTARHEPLEATERRNGLASLAILGLLLPVLLASTGRIDAYNAMCDGGDLNRIQLYTNREPDSPPADSAMCGRLVAQTDQWVWVFFPSQTERVATGGADMPEPAATAPSPDDTGAVVQVGTPPATPTALPALPESPAQYQHVVTVYQVARDDIEASYVAAAGGGSCPTCVDGTSGEERYLIDPDELLIGGVVDTVAAEMLVTLSDPTTSVASFQMLAETQVLVDGEAGTVADVRPGRVVRALGTLDQSGAFLLARQVSVQTTGAPVLEPQLDVTLDSAQRSFILAGEDWPPGASLSVGLGIVGATEPLQPFGDGVVQVGPDGTFNAPYTFDPAYPTGAGWVVIVSDPATGIYATAPWFQQPPPTPVPTPTAPPAPTEGALETPTPEAEATGTNTPLSAPGLGILNCEPDEFEPDGSRGTAGEIFVTFAEGGTTQAHNFCPFGDLDLAWFRVKQGRWYRVYTTNLAPGVDTVMQVGDLSNSTPCEPAGCWSDDRAALTFESEVVFQALEDDTAMITVDNFGSLYGTEATYELGVEEFQPEPTPTLTPYPSATATRTPTASATPKPFPDRCDDVGTVNNTCANACSIGFAPELATIRTSTDRDWYLTIPLGVGSYLVVLEPPDDIDLDLQVLERPCPGTLLGTSRQSGDDREEVPFNVTSAGAQVLIHVYPADADQVDQHNPYLLQLFALGATEVPPPTPTTVFTAAPTATSTPTLSVPVP